MVVGLVVGGIEVGKRGYWYLFVFLFGSWVWFLWGGWGWDRGGLVFLAFVLVVVFAELVSGPLLWLWVVLVLVAGLVQVPTCLSWLLVMVWLLFSSWAWFLWDWWCWDQGLLVFFGFGVFLGFAGLVSVHFLRLWVAVVVFAGFAQIRTRLA